MLRVLVTGKDGQLAQCIKSVSKKFFNLEFCFKSSSELDITNYKEVVSAFKSNQYDYCINCAAYTNVDKAETERELAYSINVLGTKHLVDICRRFRVTLIHVSTDFVFDGNASIPYTENSITKPIGVYGKTKLEGEKIITKTLKNYFILRTSWLYSEYGDNFLKTILNLERERNELNVVSDQIGSPTYAVDLAEVILGLIQNKSTLYGVYHYSNEGVTSWYDFACAIFEECNIVLHVRPIKSKDYPTLAKRPKFSVLDKSKFKKNMRTNIPYWRDSLKKACSNIDFK